MHVVELLVCYGIVISYRHGETLLILKKVDLGPVWLALEERRGQIQCDRECSKSWRMEQDVQESSKFPVRTP